MRVVVGKKVHGMDRAALVERATAYREMAVDFGTGDGRFVLDRARREPEVLCLGLDAVQAAMRRSSRRAASKVARGGAPNALFVVAAVEELPGDLEGLASRLTVNFPWGSLLRAVALPDVEVLQRIAAVGRSGARLTALINYAVFEDDAYRVRLGLPPMEHLVEGEALPEGWRQAGLEVRRRTLLARDVPHRTSWGQRLVVGSGRGTLHLEAVKADLEKH
ncbi:MAG: class I SAM-dependent methyltransferase [Acidobacteriota bacterium]